MIEDLVHVAKAAARSAGEADKAGLPEMQAAIVHSRVLLENDRPRPPSAQVSSQQRAKVQAALKSLHATS